MYDSNISDLVGNLASVTTILQFLSGVLVCKKYADHNTTAEASPLPFLCGVLSTVLWLMYGLTKSDTKIVFVNTVGLSLMSVYTSVFYKFSYKKSSVLKQIIISVLIIFFILGYVCVETDHDILLSRIGLVACSFTLLTIAAPMSKLLHVMKVKSTDCLPFPMILMSFFVSTLWYIYGQFQRDMYLMTPNFIGACLAALQLSLFVIFPSTPQSPVMSKTLLA